MNPSSTSAQKTPATDPGNVDLLFQYYQILKQDLLLQTGSFKNHVRNSQIIGSALIAILSFLISSNNYTVTSDNVFLWLVVTGTFTTVTYYLIYDVLEAVFAVRALEECLSFLEDRVNATLGANRLIWQSGVAQNLWPTSTDIGFLAPMRCLEFYETILILGATVFLPSYIYYKAWNAVGDGSAVRHVLVGLELYSLLSAVVTIFVLRGVNGLLRAKVREMILKKWEQLSASGLEAEMT
jgi:hypothetical protein